MFGTIENLLYELPASAATNTDAATLPSITQLSADENAQLVDANTAASVTVPSFSESTEFIDTATISDVTTPDFAEDFVPAGSGSDAATIASITEFSGSDVAEYIDESTIPSITELSADEIREHSDNATFSSKTTLSWSEHFCHINPYFRAKIHARWDCTVGDFRFKAALDNKWTCELGTYTVRLENRRWSAVIEEVALLNVC